MALRWNEVARYERHTQLTGNSINNVFIEDAYIYRLAPKSIEVEPGIRLGTTDMAVLRAIGDLAQRYNQRTRATQVAAAVKQSPFLVGHIIEFWKAQGLFTATQVVGGDWVIADVSETLRRMAAEE